jgi:hypothetical protein
VQFRKEADGRYSIVRRRAQIVRRCALYTCTIPSNTPLTHSFHTLLSSTPLIHSSLTTSPCWAEKEGKLQPGDLLASANGQICLDERPFADVVTMLQVHAPPRTRTSSYTHHLVHAPLTPSSLTLPLTPSLSHPPLLHRLSIRYSSQTHRRWSGRSNYHSTVLTLSSSSNGSLVRWTAQASSR